MALPGKNQRESPTTSRPSSADLFSSSENSLEADGTEESLPSTSQTGVSVEWFAKKQLAYWEAGLESAKAFCAAKGIAWPHS